MSTKLDLGKIFFLILFLTLSVMTVMAGTIKGSITDKQTREPLTGATVQIVGTTQGAIADMDGNYSLNVTNGIYTLSIKYIGYKDIVVNNVKSGKAEDVYKRQLFHRPAAGRRHICHTDALQLHMVAVYADTQH